MRQIVEVGYCRSCLYRIKWPKRNICFKCGQPLLLSLVAMEVPKCF